MFRTVSGGSRDAKGKLLKHQLLGKNGNFLPNRNKINCNFVLVCMKRNLTIRLFIGILVVAVSLVLFSYARARVSGEEEPNSETGKCGKAQSEFILWQSLTHNLLISRR
jgi:hypothetical protein